jgi:5-methylcytosine-specific restriction endonuclease McrBC regulatory subunit McrC
MRAAKHMDGVGRLRPGDIDAVVERRTSHYADAADLARQVLDASGRTFEAGERKSWTFLIRTPGPIEVGLRAVITDGLADLINVSSGSRQLDGAAMTVNPDLVFSDTTPIAVGDIKYKVVEAGSGWNRSDLYETVAFAAAYQVADAVVVNFGSRGSELPTVGVGPHQVASAVWPAQRDISPQLAAAEVVEALRAWLSPR